MKSHSKEARIKILICGGRDFTNYDLLANTMDKLCLDREWVWDTEYCMPDVIVISGKAKGADTLAIDWAVVNWLQWEEYPTDWKMHGKAAGHIRNQQMLDEGKPDLVVAFPGGRGTADMVRRSKKAGIEVIEINE